MTKVVAIDSSGSVTSIGVGQSTAQGSADARFVTSAEGRRNHAEVIDQLMARVIDHLAGHRPDAIAVGVGPGPYSGLRVGIAFAIGLGRAWQVPVLGVCSLDAIAWTVLEEATSSSEFIVTTDARRSELYWAKYDSAATRIAGPRVMDRDSMDTDLPVVNDHPVDAALMATRVATFLEAGCAPVDTDDQWAPHGADGSQVRVPVGPLLTPRPLYLRAPDITVSNKTVNGRRS